MGAGGRAGGDVSAALERLSAICLELPEAKREVSGRHASFRVRGRTFAQSVYIRYSVVGLALFGVLMYFGLRNDLFGSGG